jgi:hypothetical protein
MASATTHIGATAFLGIATTPRPGARALGGAAVAGVQPGSAAAPPT